MLTWKESNYTKFSEVRTRYHIACELARTCINFNDILDLEIFFLNLACCDELHHQFCHQQASTTMYTRFIHLICISVYKKRHQPNRRRVIAEFIYSIVIVVTAAAGRVVVVML